MYCTTHEQHDCMTCRSLTAEKELAEAKAELLRLRAQKPCLFAYKIFSSSSGFVYTTDESEAVMGGADSGGYKKLYAQPVLDPTQVSDEPVIDKPTLPPGWQVVRVPDVEFQPRDQIYISKIGVDGKAERGGTACRLDDSSLFWHFFNDWLLMQEGAG